MLVTAVNPNRGPGFPAGRPSLLNRGKFPVLREFQLARRVFAAFCCISEAESRNIKGLALIFSGSVRVRAHARVARGNRRHATRWRGAVRAMLRFDRFGSGHDQRKGAGDGAEQQYPWR